MSLVFADDGAQLFPGAAAADMHTIVDALADVEPEKAGVRLTGIAGLRLALLATGAIGDVAAEVLGGAPRPVRAVLFDKTASMNWSLTWHQDRTVVVRRRIETPGFGPWSTKAGLQHVAPPFGVLEGMATLRIHLDDVDAENAPLLIACGSHRLGRVAADRAEAAAVSKPIHACLARAGDVWAYATPILHASEAAAVARRRRVLQIDYALGDLPGGLEWLGV